MSMDKETSTDERHNKQRWLMFGRRAKMSHSEARAAPQEAEEHRDSCAAPGAQAAAAESRAVAPLSLRARGQALLHSLWRGSRAILSRVAAVFRRHRQEPGTQQHLHQGMEAAMAAGAESRAAAPHSPCCPRSPSSGPRQALGVQGHGAEVRAVLATPDGEENACSSLQHKQEVENHSCTARGQSPALLTTDPHSWAEASTCDEILGDLPPSPSPNQVEARWLWAIEAARVLLQGLHIEDGDTSEDVQTHSSGDESDNVPCHDEPKHMEPGKGTGLLELSPQTGDQPAAKEEDRSVEELPEEKWNAITIHTIWVNPLYPQLLVDPESPLGEEADAELPSTSCALAAPRDTQPAAAAPATAPEDEEHPVRDSARPQQKERAAASAASGPQAAAAESQAVALLSPGERGQALLHSLRRGSRAILSRVAAVFQRHRQQPGVINVLIF
ncbi:uncharacterized protein LOC130256411 [Oenanthe melanoleuca]|uniref:uncharacterized protein LOC130256411 n=1 Tax=Oenanthe melanoleuca TaxID=2939378 RepID=UPI0024C2055C|nr:uncharacterized protein LOC130256411 [Oenanthe melanoleuca]